MQITDSTLTEDSFIGDTAVESEIKKTGSKKIDVVYKKKPVFEFVKRIADIVCSLLGLIVLSPLFLIVSVLIMIDDFGNPFFLQKRTGKGGKVFKMFKFRSMYKNAEQKRAELLEQNEADGPIFKIAKDPRITRIGRFIRKTSIDELPQLINILNGTMSIVGPRPLPTYEQAECNEYEAQRLLVKSGLTGYWQAYGRSDANFAEMIEYDLSYVNERSIATDIKVIAMTAVAVVKHKGAY